MDTEAEISHFIRILERHGLTVIAENVTYLRVANPLNLAVSERVMTTGGVYATDSGYELGEIGDDTASAERLAFLLVAGPNASNSRNNKAVA